MNQMSGPEPDAHAGFTLAEVPIKRAHVWPGNCQDLAALLVAAPAAPTSDSQRLTRLAHRLWERAQCLRASLDGDLTVLLIVVHALCWCARYVLKVPFVRV